MAAVRGSGPSTRRWCAGRASKLRLAVTALRAGVLRYVTEDGTIVESDARTPAPGAAAGPVDVIDGAVASASVPMVFPPHPMGDDDYVDGGVIEIVPVRAAVALGATRIIAVVAVPLRMDRDERDYAAAPLGYIGLRSMGMIGVAERQISIIVGAQRPADVELVAATDAALARGIKAAQPGCQLGDLGSAIGTQARQAGYGLLADHGGHGVGRAMHEDPFVYNEGRPGHGHRVRPGLVIAIEPMLIADGTDDYVTDRDGWTLRTATGSRAAHSEHTIAITEDGPWS